MTPWTPAHPLSFPTMSDEEAYKLRDDGLREVAAAYGLTDPPDVALIRWTSWNDVGATVAQCLRDAGFNAIGAGIIVSYPDGIPPAQATAFDLALYVCTAEYTVHPKYAEPFTADQFGVLYDYYVEFEVPCVATLGVTVSQTPTRETFIAQSLQQGTQTWDPWSEAQEHFAASDEGVISMSNKCPPYPSAQYMWG